MPKWLTEEEKLRLHEIDRNREPTDPPPQPSRNIAEFEPMSGALIRFPLGIPVSLVALMSEEIQVISIVADQNVMSQAINTYQNNGVTMGNCSFLMAPTNSIYTRDYGPWFVFDDNNEIGIVDFEYDRPRPDDNAIPGIFAAGNNINYYHMGLVHTGGDYMSEGMGTAASTTAAYSVNSGFTPAQVDSIMSLYLGIDEYHVVPNIHGGLSHIDTWAKFLAPDKMMIREVPPSHPYYNHAEQAVAYFESQISSYGTPYRVYRVYTPDNEPYTNSLILNNRVFVPLTGSQWDNAAIGAFEEAMPGYEVHGILYNYWNSNDALHCRVREIADREMLYIYHEPIVEDQQYYIDYEIRARIITMSGEALYADSLRVYYRIDDGEFNYVMMDYEDDHWYTALIPQQEIDSRISYYVHAADESGRSENHPYIGPYDPHTFHVIGPLVFLDAHVDDSNYGNNNGIFEPGETVEIIARYINKGQDTIHDITAQLLTASPYISIHPPGSATYNGGLVPEGEVMFSFAVSSSLAAPEVCLALFDLEVVTGNGYDSFDSFEIEITAHVISEYFIQESFDDWLPAGWEVTSTSGQVNWQHSNTSLAGGEMPETRFFWEPSTVAVQRLITPDINTSGFSLVYLEFKHYISNYEGGYTLRVETSGDGGNTWTEIMAFPDLNMPATVERIMIDNDDVGSEGFRIAWTFDGDSWDINWWNIDDVIAGGIILYDNIAFFEGQVSLNGGPGNITDVWITAGGQITFPDETGFYSLAVLEGSHDITASLTGYATITEEGIYVAEGDTIFIDFNLDYLLSSGNLSLDHKLSIYPNPARDRFFVVSDEKITYILLFDISGQMIHNIVVNDFQCEINVNNLCTSIYFIRIHTVNRLITERILIIR